MRQFRPADEEGVLDAFAEGGDLGRMQVDAVVRERDRLEARERANDSAAFVVDEITRHVLMHVRDPCIRNEPWHVWHWWLHDQATLLLSFYDWDCPDGMCCAHPSLEPWLLDLARARVIERAEDMEFTDEWFDWQNQQHVQLLEQAQER